MTDTPRTSGTILVVDDDEFAREIIATLLRRAMPGVVVRTGVNGETGLAMYRSEKPNLLITDLRMLGMSGPELIEAVRATDASTPIIAITGAPDPVPVPGASEVILKTQFQTLIERARAALGARV